MICTLTAAILAIALFVSGCSRVPTPARVHVELASGTVELTAQPREFRAAAPLPADNDSVYVCIAPPTDYRLRDDWSLGRGSEPGVRFTAHATLVNGRTVPLSQLSSIESNWLCLHPDGDGPLPAYVEAVSVASSRPFTATRVSWSSGSK